MGRYPDPRGWRLIFVGIMCTMLVFAPRFARAERIKDLASVQIGRAHV